MCVTAYDTAHDSIYRAHNQSRMIHLLDILFPDEAARRKQGRCPICDQSVFQTDFRDQLSLKEFDISGMCQKCQDKIFITKEII